MFYIKMLSLILLPFLTIPAKLLRTIFSLFFLILQMQAQYDMEIFSSRITYCLDG